MEFIYNQDSVTDGLAEALKLIESDFPIVNSGMKSEGTKVSFCLGNSGPGFTHKNNEAQIYGSTIPQAMRSLSLLRGFAESGVVPDEYSEEASFDTLGLMLDASRNGVPNLDTVKLILRRMALMGMNVLMLYTEDTYEVPQQPMIGYMRGKYTQNELRELDDYANALGIEMFPCIQALAHLSHMLRWGCYSDVQDTGDILLVGEEKTYSLLSEMISAACAPYRSKRIHIGMDEAHNLGLGTYLQKHGFQPRFELMNQHLNRVMSIIREQGLKPMIWSDMYFRLGSDTGEYYDLNSRIPADVIENIPQDVQLVYWDYYHPDKAFYKGFIDRHRAMGKEPVFAGGIWSWHTLWDHIGMSVLNNNAGMAACKEKGVREAFTTAWGDDGSEVALLSMLPALQHFADHGYNAEVDQDAWGRNFRGSCGVSIEPWLTACKLDDTPGAENLQEYFERAGQPMPEETNNESDGKLRQWVTSNPSKFLLWQDPLLGLFDVYVRDLGLGDHYRRLSGQLRGEMSEAEFGSDHILFAIRLSEVLEDKAELGVHIQDAYISMDKERLREICDIVIPDLIGKVKKLQHQHYKVWFSLFKPQGWEVIDGRYGALVSRLESTRLRLNEFIMGMTDTLPELEEERVQCWRGGSGKLPEAGPPYGSIFSPAN